MAADGISRRDFARLAAAGLMGAPASGWLGTLAAHAGDAAKAGVKHKKCILLYMSGGPSHVDTFDPKPGNGEFKAISTAVPGVQISEHLPRLAKQMGDMALVRGMSTSEGSHARARYYIHTGYREGVGGVTYPTLGSIVSATIGEKKPELPNFVAIGAGGLGPGFLGPVHAPLHVGDPAKGVENLNPAGGFSELDRRMGLLDEMEAGFVERKRNTAAVAHRATYQAAFNLIHSAKAKAFDIGQEPASVRSAYGSSKFGEGCLMARRLVQIGVPFVEVDLNGWDTHKDNFNRVRKLSETLDQGMSALLADLKTHGLLDETLVIWMGDFGRSPDVKNGGRGHYPKAWTTILAGAGLKTGQAISRTDRHGAEVEGRRISVVDFMGTVCKALQIDYTKNFHTTSGRPVRVVDKNERVVSELFG